MKRIAFLVVLCLILLSTAAQSMTARRAARLGLTSSGATGCSGGTTGGIGGLDAYPGYTYSPHQGPGGTTIWVPEKIVVPSAVKPEETAKTIEVAASKDCKTCGQTKCTQGVCQTYKCEKGQCNIAEVALQGPPAPDVFKPMRLAVTLTFDSGATQAATVVTDDGKTGRVVDVGPRVEPPKPAAAPQPAPVMYYQSAGSCSGGG